MSSIFHEFRMHLPRLTTFACAAAMFGMAFSPQIHAQTIGFGGATQLIDNVANQGSPTIITYNNQKYMYYVNHGNSTIYVDVGLTGNPQSTGITVYTGALTDVGAAAYDGPGGPYILLVYISPSGALMSALSGGGIGFFDFNTISTSSTGFNIQFVPAVIGSGPNAYLALVGNGNLVYLYESFNGQSWGWISNTQRTYSTVSRPSLALYSSGIYVAYTTGSSRQAVIGNITTGPSLIPGAGSWGNSNQNGAYAGLALVKYGSYLYAYGQNTASSQNLNYISSVNGSSWSGVMGVGNQLRWTPSLTVVSGAVCLVYQDDGNTNISYRVN